MMDCLGKFCEGEQGEGRYMTFYDVAGRRLNDVLR